MLRQSLFLIAFVVALAKTDNNNQPNVVFLLADDLGYNDVGYSKYSQCHNGFSVETPFIDKLASEGLQLKHSYTPAVCTPSRAAIMSGTYPFRYGFQRGVLRGWEKGGLDLNLKLLPQYMKDKGYQTHLVGKWHLGYCNKAYTPLERGFDSFFGYLGGGIGYYDHLDDQKQLDYYNGKDLLYSNNYSMDDFAAHAVGLIENNTSPKPMFLFLSAQAVHAPLDLVPGSTLRESSLNRHKLLDMAKVLDKFAEKVVHALRQKDMWKNTVFIMTSDNGGQPKFGGNNYPLRGKKNSLWEGGTRIRSFVHGKHVPRGTYDGLFHSVDWLPTILGIAGQNDDNSDIDGVNQWTAMKTNAKKLKNQPRDSFIYSLDEYYENNKSENRTAIRYRTEDFDYKLILGTPSSIGRRYDPCVLSEPDQNVFRNAPNSNNGFLYDMSVDDAKLEETEVEGREDVKKLMIDMIMKEKKKGYVSPTSDVSDKYAMFDSRGHAYAGPGWC